MGHDLSQDAEIWDDAYKLDRAHVFHSWPAQRNLDPTEVVTGHGVWLKYGDGREMLDFTSQQVNVNIGYQHPKVIEGIKKQAELLCTIGPDYANLARGRAASLVARRAPEGFDKVFFTNAGADANENAMRAARLFTGRDKILSSYRCYHGNTGAAISATGDWRRKPNDYSRGHVHFFTPYLYRSEFSATTQEEECERALAHLEHVIQFEGPDTIAAVLLESVPGTAGIIIPPKDYFKGVREITKKYSILMITDEVMAGFGRTGFWFALDDYDYTPDIISFAKGCNSGYVPAGGVIMSDPVAHRFDDIVFPGGLTYSGHPLAMGAIVATPGSHGRGAYRRQRLHHRQGRARPAAHRSVRQAPEDRRGSRQGRVLGRGNGCRPHHQGAAGRRHDEADRGRRRQARPDSRRAQQPHPRHSSLRHLRRRGDPGRRDPRPGADRGRLLIG